MMSARSGWLARVRSTARAIFGRRRLEQEMEEEIRFHLDSRAADLVRSGMMPAEARRRARVEFGGPATHKSGIRDALGLRWWDELRGDLAYGLRMLRKSPGFTAVAVGSLALAIGANTTAFSVANLLLYQRLRVPHPEQLCLLLMATGEHSPYHAFWNSGNGEGRTDVLSYPVYQELRKVPLDGRNVIGFMDFGAVSARVGGEAVNLKPELVSGDFYSQMEIRPVLGRSLNASDDRLGAPFVAVISYATWQRSFAGDRDVLNRQILLGGIPVSIVGVNPPGYTGVGSVLFGPDISVPLALLPLLQPTVGKEDPMLSGSLCWVHVLMRVPSGSSEERWATELKTRFASAVRGTTPIGKTETVPALFVVDGSRGRPIVREMVGNSARFLQGFVALVLLLACANVANLVLARSIARQREMAVRLALGANRFRVLRQVLTESLLLAGLGGSLGVVFAYPLRTTLARGLLPSFLGGTGEEGPVILFSWPVFVFTAAVTLVTALLFGLIPAWRCTHADVNTVMKEGARAPVRRQSAWRGKGIVAVQLALSTILVVAAAIFTNTLVRLLRIDLGFQPRGLLLLQVSPPTQRYTGTRATALHIRLQEEIGRMPGVEDVSATDVPLLAGWSSSTDLNHIEGQPEAHKLSPGERYIDVGNVGPGYFHVMQIPLLRGREFSVHDTLSSPPVAVVNQLFADKFFAHSDPIGHRISVGEDDKGARAWLEIVGVSGNTVYDEIKDRKPVIVWTSFRQNKDTRSLTYVIRTGEPVDRIGPALRRVIQSADSDLPVTDMRTQEQQIASSLQQQLTFAALATGFGLLALTLACVGVYGVMSYTVSQRTSEIGIRLALGAQREQVRRMVLREALWLTATGVVSGVIAALALSKMVRALLYDVEPRDPLSFTLAATVLLLVGMLAAAVPAMRASHIEPMEALRHE